MTTAAPLRIGSVVVGAGRSRRMAGIDKIFVSLAGPPLFTRSVSTLARCTAVAATVFVTAGERCTEARRVLDDLGIGGVAVCAGGEDRTESVRRGLVALGACDVVLVHDAARPLLTTALVNEGLAAVRECGATVAAVPIGDTVKQVNAQGTVLRTIPRAGLWAVQTPQVFDYALLLRAHEAAVPGATDDAMLVEGIGGRVTVYPGSPHNIKVTTPDDLSLAVLLLQLVPEIR